MNLKNMVRNYIYDDTFKIIYQNNKLSIVNYNLIDHFDENKIIVSVSTGRIIIKGNYLTVAKLLNDELLITGKIKNIELNTDE